MPRSFAADLASSRNSLVVTYTPGLPAFSISIVSWEPHHVQDPQSPVANMNPSTCAATSGYQPFVKVMVCAAGFGSRRIVAVGYFCFSIVSIASRKLLAPNLPLSHKPIFFPAKFGKRGLIPSVGGGGISPLGLSTSNVTWAVVASAERRLAIGKRDSFGRIGGLFIVLTPSAQVNRNPSCNGAPKIAPRGGMSIGLRRRVFPMPFRLLGHGAANFKTRLAQKASEVDAARGILAAVSPFPATVMLNGFRGNSTEEVVT